MRRPLRLRLHKLVRRLRAGRRDPDPAVLFAPERDGRAYHDAGGADGRGSVDGLDLLDFPCVDDLDNEFRHQVTHRANNQPATGAFQTDASAACAAMNRTAAAMVMMYAFQRNKTPPSLFLGCSLANVPSVAVSEQGPLGEHPGRAFSFSKKS